MADTPAQALTEALLACGNPCFPYPTRSNAQSLAESILAALDEQGLVLVKTSDLADVIVDGTQRLAACRAERDAMQPVVEAAVALLRRLDIEDQHTKSGTIGSGFLEYDREVARKAIATYLKEQDA